VSIIGGALNLNISQFVSGLNRANAATASFVSSFGAQMRQMSQHARQADNGIGNITKSLSTIGKVYGLTLVAGALYDIGKAATESAQKMENFQYQYKAVFGSGEAGAREFSQLTDFVKKFGLELETTAGAYARFSAAASGSALQGQKGSEVFQKLTSGMQGIGMTAEQQGRVFLQVQQMLSTGSVKAEEMRVIAETLPAAYRNMADAMGMTLAKFKEGMRKSTIDADEAMEKLSDLMYSKYGKVAEEVAKNSLNAAMNNAKTAMFEMMSSIGTFIKPLVQWFSKVFVSLSGYMKFALATFEMTWARIVIRVGSFVERIAYRLNPANWLKSGAQMAVDDAARKSLDETAIRLQEEEVAKKYKLYKEPGKSFEELQTERKAAAEAKAEKEQERRDAEAKKAAEKRAREIAAQAKSITEWLDKQKVASQEAFDAAPLNAYQQAIEKVDKTFKDSMVSNREFWNSGGNDELKSKFYKQWEDQKELAAQTFETEQWKEAEDAIAKVNAELLELSDGDEMTRLERRLAAIPARANQEFKKLWESISNDGPPALDKLNKYLKVRDEFISGLSNKATGEVFSELSGGVNSKIKEITDAFNRAISGGSEDSSSLGQRIKKSNDDYSRYLSEIIPKLQVIADGNSSSAKGAGELIDKLKTLDGQAGMTTLLDNMNKLGEQIQNNNDELERTIELLSRPQFSKMTGNDPYLKTLMGAIAPQFERQDIEDGIYGKYSKQFDDIEQQMGVAGISDENYNILVDQWNELVDMADKEVELKIKATGFENVQGVVGQFTQTLQGPLTDAIMKYSETGKVSFGELAKSFLKSIQTTSAALTSQLLAYAAFAGIMAAVSSVSSLVPAMATVLGTPVSWGNAAAMALAGAAAMGALTVSAGLISGMAHDGISSVPEDGTWLLQKGERVVDERTNRDLKEYLKNGSRGSSIINMPVTINGGDEQSVIKALPQLKEAILDAINSDIRDGGRTRNTIRTYAT